VPRQGLLRWGHRTFAPTDLVVMGIVNVTDDSFYPAAGSPDPRQAAARLDRLAAEGADVVDIGAVPAAPGREVTDDEEIGRLLPVVAHATATHPELVISVDTHRAAVADAALAHGAHVINDAWGLPDPDLAAVVASHQAGLVCTHAGGLSPRAARRAADYPDLLTDVRETLTRLATTAESAGVPGDRIAIDPGHDFGKDTSHSLLLTRRLDLLTTTGWPVLVALSRKDFLGEVLDLPVEQRLEGSLAAAVIAAWLGARIFRVHDVAATVRALSTVAAIRGDLNQGPGSAV
jgi:dihydropteroate synthase